MTEDKTFPSRSTTAAAVSSHDDSIPKMKSLLIQIPEHFRFSHKPETFDRGRINSAIHQRGRRRPQLPAVDRKIRCAVELGQDILHVVGRFRAMRVRAGYEQRTGFAQHREETIIVRYAHGGLVAP